MGRQTTKAQSWPIATLRPPLPGCYGFASFPVAGTTADADEILAAKSTLSEGGLDGSDDALAKTRLKAGREANLTRLKQILNLGVNGKPVNAPVRPTDPVLDFAERVVDSLGDALAHCQEAMVPGRNQPVILAIVRESSRASAVHPIFHATDWNGQKPELRVLDQAASLPNKNNASGISAPSPREN